MTNVEALEPTAGDLFFAEVFDPANRADPYPLYERMREQGPLFDAGNNLWFIFGHELANSLLRAKGTSSNEQNSTFFKKMLEVDERMLKFAEEEPIMLFLDPPDHTRLRKMVSAAFTPRTVERLVPRIQKLTDELLDAVAGESSFELIEHFAHPLPVAVICEMLGIPKSDEPLFSEWSNLLTQGLDPGVLRSEEDNERIEVGRDELMAYTSELLAARRNKPEDDLISELLAVRDGQDRLSEDELVKLVVLLLVAGHETTVNLIGNGMVALLRHPDQLARWQADPAIRKSAVDELLRYDSPVQLGMRVLVEPTELGGVEVPAGDQVLTMLGSANRDSAVFDDPNTLDLTRTNAARNLSFGGGIHHCLGMALARVEGQIALGSLIERYDSIELASDPDVRARLVLRGYDNVVMNVA